MSVIPKITCRRCGREYSGLRSRCPYCGTGRSKSAERIPLRTSSENAGTPAAEHAAVNTKWQMLFGGILLLAVVAAVIVLITVSLNASQNTPSVAEPTPPATVSSAAPHFRRTIFRPFSTGAARSKRAEAKIRAVRDENRACEEGKCPSAPRQNMDDPR